MDDTRKPFACTVDGCQMTFTNEDHLNWHHKKHDMVLNLGLANKSSEVADQTPTPTRFIRNCEEVGLFQDLQNVNPFDETFKNAIECSKTGGLHVPDPSNDDNDTLHTPHILPHVVESCNVNKYIDSRSDNHSNQSGEFCIDSVQVSSIQNGTDVIVNKESSPNQDHDNVGNKYGLTINIDNKTSNEGENKTKNRPSVDLKNKLKNAIRNKKNAVKGQTVVITPTSQEYLKYGEEMTKKRVQSGSGSGDIERIRELNRAAQVRCRRRKQSQWQEMEEDLTFLRKVNYKLVHENRSFSQKFAALKSLVLKKRNDAQFKDSALLGEIENILVSTPQTGDSKKENNSPTSSNSIKTNPVLKQQLIRNKPKPVTQIVTLPVTQSPIPGNVKPVLIQITGPVGQVALSVFPK